MTHSPWQRPLGPFDVAIVGGGVIGASTAYALAHMRPALRVAIVEAERVAYGASGRNAGFVMPGSSHDPTAAREEYGDERARRLLRFTLETADRVAALARTVPIEYIATGHRLAAGAPGEASRLRASVDILLAEGVPARLFEGEEANRHAGSDGFEALLEYDAGGTVHSAKLVRALVGFAGADLLERWPVTGLESAGNHVVLSGPGGARIEAGRVLLAVNAYLPRLLPALAEVVRPVRAQMLITEPLAPALDRPVYSHEGFFYIRQRADGRVMLGGARHLHEADEVGYEDATTDAVQESLEVHLCRHFPRLAGAGVARRWSGTMGFSPDGLPVVGDVAGVAGALFAAGFTGHGMGYSMRFGEMLARRLTGETDEADDLFDAGRFARVG